MNTNVPGYAGIIIIAAATWLVTVFGYKVVHHYEGWSWIPSTIIFLIVLGEFAHSGQFSNLPMAAGTSEAGSILSFAASVFGFATGWTSYAADYTVYQPVNVSRIKTFAWTWGGLILPLAFTEMLGLAVATATINNQDYANGYDQSGIGGLLAAVLFPPLGRFGQFCLIILALSIIANNCPNIYSLTFSLQLMTHYTQAVPRFIWTFIGTLVYCAIAIPGYSHFESVLENFMLLIVRVPLPITIYISQFSLQNITGLLASHLRRHLPNRALHLQKAQVRHRHLELPCPPSPRRSRSASFLLWRLRCRNGYGAGMVHWSHRPQNRYARVWRGYWIRACICVQCHCHVCLEDF